MFVLQNGSSTHQADNRKEKEIVRMVMSFMRVFKSQWSQLRGPKEEVRTQREDGKP